MWFFGLPWIISFHYEPPVGRAQAVTPQVLLKNTRLVSQRAGHSGHFLSPSDLFGLFYLLPQATFDSF